MLMVFGGYIVFRQFSAAVLLTCCPFVATAVGSGTIGYDETKAIFADQTVMSHDSAHGTQVEYLSRAGKTYLLYPGNTTVVKGEWRLNRTDQPDVFSMCFRYPSNSYNPATGQTGGAWECQPAGFYLNGLSEMQQGDGFGLSRSSTVPFVLSHKKTTLSQLAGEWAWNR